jgi:ketosteroid isomerase-like protein
VDSRTGAAYDEENYEDNVGTVQTIYEPFGRGDVATIVDTLADRFEWHRRGASAVPRGKSGSTKEEVGTAPAQD